jgi:hypothetical protein
MTDIVDGGMSDKPPMPNKHRGKFKWKKYSKYSGNLRLFWTAKDRPDQTRHRAEEHLHSLSVDKS